MSNLISHPLVKANFSLKALNTLAVESTAEFFAEASNLTEVNSLREFAQKKHLPVWVLGGGSNVVMPDHVQGLVLRYINADCTVVRQDDASITVEVGAGFVWHDFVLFSVQQGWFGLENLALIPGTVGAAPVQNIGAYGVEVEQFIESVQGVFLETGEPFTFSCAQCEFAYRESCFKQSLDGQTLITSVTFKLLKRPKVNVAYAPLNKMAEQFGMPSPMELAKWVMQVRSEKLPDPKELPNAGSFFKNPVITQAQFNALAERYPDMPSYPLANQHGEQVKVPAGWLIDQLGFKGRCFADAVYVHKQQALVLVNQGGSGAQVMRAAADIKQAVFEHYGIELEQEPRLFAAE